MGTLRYFGGSRENSNSVASDIKRMEIQKRGKFDAAQRRKMMLDEMKRRKTGEISPYKMSSVAAYQKLLRDKMGDQQAELDKEQQKLGLHGKNGSRKMSLTAQNAMKQVAMRKAAKQAKAMRRMVLVTPKNFSNGSINKKGKIYDVAGNVIGEVNLKNGKMYSMTGMTIGQYKAGKFMTNLAIQEAINKYSPYFINLRKMQMMQQGGVWGGAGETPMGVWGNAATQEVINVHGGGFNRGGVAGAGGGGLTSTQFSDSWGVDVAGPRQNVGLTSWGARSDNVHGTFADNAWGVSADNVWGGTASDVWGGISAPGGWWGWKGPKVWGTGNNKNYLRALTNFIAAFFGLKGKNAKAYLSAGRDAIRFTSGRRSSGSVSRSAPSAPRSAPSAPRSGR